MKTAEGCVRSCKDLDLSAIATEIWKAKMMEDGNSRRIQLQQLETWTRVNIPSVESLSGVGESDSVSIPQHTSCWSGSGWGGTRREGNIKQHKQTGFSSCSQRGRGSEQHCLMDLCEGTACRQVCPGCWQGAVILPTLSPRSRFLS